MGSGSHVEVSASRPAMATHRLPRQHALFIGAIMLTVPGLAFRSGAQCVHTPAALQQPTATLSQACGGAFGVGRVIDGNFATGWAIYSNTSCGLSEFTFNQTAVFEAVQPLEPFTPGEPFRIVVSILSGGINGAVTPHTLGLFRVSVTGDDRSTFADGLANGGDVTAAWTALAPESIRAVATNSLGADTTAPATTLTLLPDGSVLASGNNPEYARYELIATSPFAAVTGVRLEVFDSNGASSAADMGLPTGGPGRAVNGNFILRELRVERAPCLEVCTHPQPATSCAGGTHTFSVAAEAVSPFAYQWQVETSQGSGTYVDVANGPLAGVGTVSGSTTHEVTIAGLASGASAMFRCVVSNTCGDLASNPAALTVSLCDCVDFNSDGLFPDTTDIDDFLSVFSGGSCSTGTCGDTDFNNDGLFPDTLDIDSLLSVFSGGACL